MATTKLLLAVFCFAFTGSIGMLKRDLLVKDRGREKLVNLATREIGVREKTGHNDGIRVEF